MTAYIRFFLMDILFRLGLGMRCLHGHRKRPGHLRRAGNLGLR